MYLVLVMHNSMHGNRAPIQIGTRLIDKAIRLITKEELNRETDTWKKTHAGVALTKANQVSKNGFQLEKVKEKVT